MLVPADRERCSGRMRSDRREGRDRGTSRKNDQETMSFHDEYDAASSSGRQSYCSPASNETRNLSEFEASLMLHDEQYSILDRAVSWRSATLTNGAMELRSRNRGSTGLVTSRRKLLHSCGFTQCDDSLCSQDEVIRRTATQDASHVLGRNSVDVAAARRPGGRVWMGHCLRSGCHCEEPVICRCLCLYSFKAAS